MLQYKPSASLIAGVINVKTPVFVPTVPPPPVVTLETKYVRNSAESSLRQPEKRSPLPSPAQLSSITSPKELRSFHLKLGRWLPRRRLQRCPGAGAAGWVTKARCQNFAPLGFRPQERNSLPPALTFKEPAGNRGLGAHANCNLLLIRETERFNQRFWPRTSNLGRSEKWLRLRTHREARGKPLFNG